MTSNFTASELRAMVPRVSVASFAEIAVIQAMLREYAAVKQAVKELGTGPALYEPGVMDWILARAAELSAQESKPFGYITAFAAKALQGLHDSNLSVDCRIHGEANGDFTVPLYLTAPSVSAQDASPKCGWSANDDGFYETSCGKTFVTSDGTAEENGFKFCCFCGKTLTAPEPK